MNGLFSFACLSAGVLAAMATAARAADGFVDHGVAAKVAESRGVVVTRTASGRFLALCNTLDQGPTSFILVTDIDSGETRQVYCPKDVPNSPAYGSLMHSNGRFYTTQGSIFLEFDPDKCEWTFHKTGSPIGSCYIGFTEAPGGTVWAGSVGQTGLISFNPQTRELVDYGRMDDKESYLNYLAVDDKGWVYCGIGMARCNLVAFNPATRERRSLVPEDKRTTGSGTVTPTSDGKVHGQAAGLSLVLYDGQATPVSGQVKVAPRRAVNSIGWGQSTGVFPDGRQLTGYDLPGRWLRVFDPKTGETRRIVFDYQTEGASLTSLAVGPAGRVYASSCHPMHLVALDTGKSALTDLGPIPRVGGGNFCAMATQRGLLIGAQYSHGSLWAYDPVQPWNPTARREVIGVSGRDLAKQGECRDGHFTYLESYDVAFLCGDKFGAEGTFKLTAAAAGAYYLHVLPLRSARYCTVQLLFDGAPLGEPYVAKAANTEPGALLVYGPLTLTAGEHKLTVRTLATPGQEPWCAIAAVDLSREKRDALVRTAAGNPWVLATWHDDICRPRTALAHPDGRHVMMAGFAGYGLCGGGIGIVDLETGTPTLLKADPDLLPGHSCVTLKALPSGDLVGGTSVAAPGGGHTTAKEAELFILDWKTKKLAFHAVPVPGDGNVVSIEVAPNGLVYGLASKGELFVFDPAAKQVVRRASLAAYGGVPRHALFWGPDGRLYALMSKAILQITPESLAATKLAEPPTPITGGGALVNGVLAYAANSHLWTYKVPGL